MKKLQIYILLEFLTMFFGAIFFFVVLVTVADLSIRLEHYARNPDKILYFMFYHLLKAPHNMYYIYPVALMFSSTYVLGNFVKNKEMLAIQNGGISLFKFSAPMFISATILCVLLVVFWEYVAAPANKKLFNVNDLIYGSGSSDKRNNISFFGDNGYIYFVDEYTPSIKEMSNATIMKISEDGYVESRITAPIVRWDESISKWNAFNIAYVHFDSNKNVSIESLDSLTLGVSETPELFNNPPRIETMSLKDLSRFINLRKAINMNVNWYATEFHHRISYAFSGIVVVILASLFSRFSKQSVLVVSLVLVILVALIYYSVLMLFKSMGEIGLLPPFLSAWLPNIMFLVGSYLAFKKFD